MTKHNFFKRTVCIAAAAAALFTSAAIPFPAAAAEDGDTTETQESTLPTHLMNGDFEWPSIDDALNSDYAQISTNDTGDTSGEYKQYTISNNSNDNPDIIFKQYSVNNYVYKDPWFLTTQEIMNEISSDQNKGDFYWETTAYDERIELAAERSIFTWNDGNGYSHTTTGYFSNETSNDAANNDQFAELVGTEESSLYQSIQTVPGNILTWRLNHRARSSSPNKTDRMAVFIGPQQTGGLKKESQTAKDVFRAMVDLITLNENETTVGSMSLAARTFYTEEIHDGMKITDNTVGTARTDTRNQEWKCWIITSDDTRWYEYSGSYTVPDNQTATTFAFAALTSNQVEGNCLDNIVFGIQYPLTVITTEGGTGTISGAGIANGTTVEHGNAYNGSANENEIVTITAKPLIYNSGSQTLTYEFVGAEINGKYFGIKKDGNTESEGFTKQDDGTYTYQLLMNEGKHVQLYFTPLGEVHYDKNGGTWEEITHVYILGNSKHVVNQSVAPKMDGQKFLHWEVFASNGVNSYHITVGADHTINYDAITKTFTVNDDEGTNVIHIEKDADKYAIILRAEYTRSLSVQPCTKYFGSDKLIHDDSVGGTVTVKNDSDQTPLESSSINVEEGNQFTVTASPNDGFEILSWWYEYTDDNNNEVIIKLDQAGNQGSYSATYIGEENVILHVQFAEKPLTPYLSAVAQDEKSKTDLTTAGITTSHGSVSWNGDNHPISELYGGEQYGNTIATGFFATRSFDDISGTLSGVWTVKIPANGSYFKINSTPTSDNINPSAAVPDDNAQINGGAIYKSAEQTGSNEYNRQVRFYTNMGTIITDGDVVFGIVIDNLYAPNAQAGFMAAEAAPTDVPTLGDNDSVLATPDDKYEQSEFNTKPID